MRRNRFWHLEFRFIYLFLIYIYIYLFILYLKNFLLFLIYLFFLFMFVSVECFDFLDCLKISDFGLATVFRHESTNRTLDTCCGTIPYLAPEVIQKIPYKAEPVDVWSCGIILIALLAGGKDPLKTAVHFGVIYCPAFVCVYLIDSENSSLFA